MHSGEKEKLMEDEMFPEESLLDAEAMFRFLRKRFDFEPSETMLEWVFGIDSESEPDEESMSNFFDAFFSELEEDDPDVRAEIHEIDEHEVKEHELGSIQFLMIYTGILSQKQLKKIHQRLTETAKACQSEYVGVEVGEVGELDGMKIDGFIRWTDGVLNESSEWQTENFADFSKRMREFHVEELNQRGLVVDDQLPAADSRGLLKLRPPEEIVRRLMAAFATIAWVCAPDEMVSEEKIKSYVETNGLADSFSSQEAEWFSSPRADVRDFAQEASWVTESVWGLAWLLGQSPTVCACEQQVPDSILIPIRDQFLGGFERSLEELLSDASVQPPERIITLEDFLFCAQDGVKNMENEELVRLVKERRQALTWALSPGVQWDETDLSC